MKRFILSIVAVLLVGGVFMSLGNLDAYAADSCGGAWGDCVAKCGIDETCSNRCQSQMENCEDCTGGGNDEKFCACKSFGGIELNTDVPFVGRCIEKTTDSNISGGVTAGNAFPRLLGGLMRILMTVVVVVGFMGILVGGFMIAGGGVKSEWVSGGKGLIVKVILGLILLGASGIILNLVNPTFFGTKTGGGGVIMPPHLFGATIAQ